MLALKMFADATDLVTILRQVFISIARDFLKEIVFGRIPFAGSQIAWPG
jgi:hypothetical protein